MNKRFLRAFFPAMALVLMTGYASPDQQLQSLVLQRLSLAPEVAWAKFQSGKPVRDPAREAEVLAKFHDPAIRRFFAAQMEASRSIQERLMATWRTGSDLPTRPPRDLRRDIRPTIDSIDNRQLAAIARGARTPDPAEIENLSKQIPAP